MATSISNISPNISAGQVDGTDRSLEVLAQKALSIAHIALPIIEVVAFTLVITLGFTFPPSMVICLIITGSAVGVCQAILPDAPFGGAPGPENNPSRPQNSPAPPPNPSNPSSIPTPPPLKSDDGSDDEIVEGDENLSIQGNEKLEEEPRLEAEKLKEKNKEDSKAEETRLDAFISGISKTASFAQNGFMATGSFISQGFSHAYRTVRNGLDQIRNILVPAKKSNPHEIEMGSIPEEDEIELDEEVGAVRLDDFEDNKKLDPDPKEWAKSLQYEPDSSAPGTEQEMHDMVRGSSSFSSDYDDDDSVTEETPLPTKDLRQGMKAPTESSSVVPSKLSSLTSWPDFFLRRKPTKKSSQKMKDVYDSL